MKIWINACEVSGDLQAGILLQALKNEYPQLEAIGMGGNKLEEAGQLNFFHINELSVMGLSEVFSAIPRIFSLWKEIKKAFRKERPDAIILVDSAEFNFPLAKEAKKLNIPVYYFIPPKVWAWRQYRVRFLQKYIKSILCILPFEVDFYKKFGIEVQYIQNPLVNFLKPYTQAKRNIIPQSIAIMPGSRKKEVSTLLPLFAQTAALLKKDFPNMTFHIIQAPHFTAEYLAEFWNYEEGAPDVNYIPNHERYDFLRTCEFCIAASGTATLETALLDIPTIISYKVSAFSYTLARPFIHVKYAGLANLILDDLLFPEYIQKDAQPLFIAENIKDWIEHPVKIQEIYKKLEHLRSVMQKENAPIQLFTNKL